MRIPPDLPTEMIATRKVGRKLTQLKGYIFTDMNDLSPQIQRVRTYPWISMGILAVLSLVNIYEGYFTTAQTTSSGSGTAGHQFTVGTLLVGLAITWAIILTPVIAASQKLHSFVDLYRIRFQWKDLGWGVGLLFANMVVSVSWNSLCFATGWVNKNDKVGNVGQFLNSKTAKWTILIVLISALLAPAFEELFFRGLLFPVLRIRISFPLAGTITAFCFALVHIQGKGSLDITTLPVIFILGFALAAVREKTGRLTPTICGHIMINFFAFFSAIYLNK
jgi:membrane protease YdiL (CAAX protease family)